MPGRGGGCRGGRCRASAGLWDAKTCRSNAQAYADEPTVLGVIGTYNSGCAAEEIPILAEAGVAMVSPGNTAVCLTQEAPSCDEYSPASPYPDGERNYARIVPNDAFHGAALAQFASDQGSASPFVLYAADDPTSAGQADNFRGAAEELGLEIAGFESWDPKSKSYEDLMGEVAGSGADAVVLAGLTDQNGGQVIEDKAEFVGPNDEVPLIAFDGFTAQAAIDDAGDSAEGMFASITDAHRRSSRERARTWSSISRRRPGASPWSSTRPPPARRRRSSSTRSKRPAMIARRLRPVRDEPRRRDPRQL